jgi:cell wall-associated NlpC family hydrolase
MKKKKLVSLTAAVVMTLGGCAASSANAFPPPEIKTEALAVVKTSPVKTSLLGLIEPKKALTMMEKAVVYKNRLAYNERRVQNIIKKVKRYAGKTWYVFSGSSPRGWDCSGMVRWAYEQTGIELEHRASAQANSGTKVKHPLPGDIVAFYHKGSTRSFHVGLYIGKGKMIHAYRHGMRTVIQPVKEVVKENWGARVTYTRILPQPQN